MATPKINQEYEAKKDQAKKLIAAGGCHAITFWSRTDAQRLCPEGYEDFPPIEAPIYSSEWVEAAKKAIQLIRTGLEILEPPPADDMTTAFQNEPVNFLLSNALRHLTQDQQRQLCNALLERLPVPVSITDEAKDLYPYTGSGSFGPIGVNVAIDMQRSAHITCARQYTDTIDKLRAENAALIEEIQNWKDELKDQAREHRNNR